MALSSFSSSSPSILDRSLLQMTCGLHKTDTFRFCTNCRIPVCIDCTEDTIHHGHSITTTMDVRSSSEKAIRGMIEALKYNDGVVAEELRKCDVYINQLRHSKKDSDEEIERRMDELQSLIKKRKQQLGKELNDAFVSSFVDLSERKTRFEQLQKDIRQTSAVAEELLKKHTCELLHKKPHLLAETDYIQRSIRDKTTGVFIPNEVGAERLDATDYIADLIESLGNIFTTGPIQGEPSYFASSFTTTPSEKKSAPTWAEISSASPSLSVAKIHHKTEPKQRPVSRAEHPLLTDTTLYHLQPCTGSCPRESVCQYAHSPQTLYCKFHKVFGHCLNQDPELCPATMCSACGSNDGHNLYNCPQKRKKWFDTWCAKGSDCKTKYRKQDPCTFGHKHDEVFCTYCKVFGHTNLECANFKRHCIKCDKFGHSANNVDVCQNKSHPWKVSQAFVLSHVWQ